MRVPRYGLEAAAMLLLCVMTVASAQPVTVDFRQAANNDRPFARGDVHWVNSILQHNNSVYYEGMSVPQRVMIANVRAARGNVHSLTFEHMAAKGGVHAYDFLTSYGQAVASATAIAGPTALVHLNECGTEMGPPATLQATCAGIRAGLYSYVVDLPDAMGTVLTHDVAARISAFERVFGNRTITLYGNAPITSAAVAFLGYSTGRDAAAQYTLSWTSASTSILVEMAAHLSMGLDVQTVGTGLAYGPGLGASSISGAPHHFRLAKLDGGAIGARDNQIMGSAVQSSLACGSTGATNVCTGSQNTYTFPANPSITSYAWSITNTGASASIVGAATASSVLVDAGGTPGTFTLTCMISDGFQMLACTTQVHVGGPAITAVPSGSVQCAGGTTTVTVGASGGIPPYTGTGTFTRGVGTHNFTVTDAKGCSSSAHVTITGPAYPLTAAAAAPNGMVACKGGTTTVVVTAAGGTAPYSGTGTFTLGAGTHTLTVTDGSGCSAIATITITEPAAALAAVAALPNGMVACKGGTTTVTVTATGGTAPYTGAGTFTLPAGTHSFTVTDAQGCTASTSVTITEPAHALTAMATASSATTCSATTPVNVTVAATGGTAPYSGTGTFTRTAGTHTFTVTDAQGCTANASVTITAQSSLSATAVAATPILCAGGTTTITVTATGGVAPYTGTGTFTRGAGTHTFTITDAGNCSTTVSLTVTEPAPLAAAASAASQVLCHGGTTTVTVTATGGTALYTGTGTFTLGAGTHQLHVTDVNGCSTSASITITQPASALGATATAAPFPCTNTSATVPVTVSATGGTPPYTGTGSFSRGVGMHTFTVTDANNCAATVSVTITAPAAFGATASATPILCNGGLSTVTVTATGGTPPYAGTGTFQRGAGTYTFTVTDAANCATTTSTVTITEPAALVAAAGAGSLSCATGSSTVTVTATGGTPPYSGTGVFSRGAGTHTFTVTDANSCSTTVSVTITPTPSLTVNLSATPVLCNGDPSTVTVTATGGTPPYSGTGTFTRQAGTYSFTVTDANNCSATESILISEPGLLNAAAGATPVLCNGGSSTITVTAMGGTPPYAGTGTFTRGAGAYTFTVTDAHSCTSTVTVTVLEPALLGVAANATPIVCGGGSSTVTVTATGGTAPYTGTGTFTRGAGTYTFTVSDANNCTASSTITITEPAAMSAAAGATPILCNGGNSNVTVTAAGGTPPYAGVGVFSRPAGTHTFTVTDANNCSASATVTITEPAQLRPAATATPIACNGGNATVTVTATGGMPPYSGTGTFQRAAGTYTFTVTDAHNCQATTTIVVTEPALLGATASATPILCNGDDATVTVTAAGGTPPYTGTGTFTRGAGTYSFTVTDVNNCSTTATITITEPAPLVAAAGATPIQCHGDNTTITVTASGGTAPYAGIGTFTRLAGTHSFTVTDAHGCTSSVSVTVTEPSLIVPAASATPITCNGGMSTVTVTASGGLPPYSGTGTFQRPAGLHTFTVTDANNCTADVTISITQPMIIGAVATSTPILCNGDLSTVTVIGTGGTPPYTGTGTFQRGPGTYTFSVSDANNCSGTTTITITGPAPLVAAAGATPIQCHGDMTTITVTATGGTTPYAGIGLFTRPAGTYTFTVTDAHGCTSDVTITVTEPSLLVPAASAPPLLCNTDNAPVTVTASGGMPPYSGVGTFLRGIGTHSFTVVDANGCRSTVAVQVLGPPLLAITANATPILCFGGTSTVTVTAAGGTPPYSGTGTFQRLPGTYTFTVTDANNCSAVATITITEPPLLVAAANATPIMCHGDLTTITVTATGGTPMYGGTGIFQRPAGTHSFTVTDANGCTSSVSVTVTEPPLLVPAAVATPILCNGGMSTVTITASGGMPPYTGTGTFQRPAGTYTFAVTDAHNCLKTVTVQILEPSRVVIGAAATPILCNGGSSTVTITASGGTPPYTGTGTFSVRAGAYLYTVTDANGCGDSTMIVIDEPFPLIAMCSVSPLCINGVRTVSVQVSGGTPPYTYYWSPGGQTSASFPIPCTYTGTLSVLVRDANYNPADPNHSSCEAMCTLNLAQFAPDDSTGTTLASRVTAGRQDPDRERIGDPVHPVDGEPSLSSTSSFKLLSGQKKSDYVLFENYPNPFNPATTIRYYVPEDSRVRIFIINALGGLIETLVDDVVTPGLHAAVWNAATRNGASVPSGRYIYRIHATSLSTGREFVSERLMLLLK